MNSESEICSSCQHAAVLAQGDAQQEVLPTQAILQAGLLTVEMGRIIGSHPSFLELSN